MEGLAIRAVTPLRTDDGLMYDIMERILGYQAALVAFELGLFTVLAKKSRTLSEICDALDLGTRPADVLVTVCISLGLVAVKDGHYSLEPVAEDHLLEESPTCFTRFISGLLGDPTRFAYASVKNAFLTDKSQVYDGEPIFESHEQNAERARAFTDIMHGHSLGPGRVWPGMLDLSGHRLMLDIAGGSGAHAIGALQRWENLRAIVLEMASVCDVTADYIAQYKLQDRMEARIGDMWNDPFPQADIHFYSNIYHDWPVEKGRFLTKKSFDSLESNGRIVIHEMLYNDERTGPFTVASFSVAMLLWAEGMQYSGLELSEMLAAAGFVDVEVIRTHGYWGIVTGRKP